MDAGRSRRRWNGQTLRLDARKLVLASNGDFELRHAQTQLLGDELGDRPVAVVRQMDAVEGQRRTALLGHERLGFGEQIDKGYLVLGGDAVQGVRVKEQVVVVLGRV